METEVCLELSDVIGSNRRQYNYLKSVQNKVKPDRRKRAGELLITTAQGYYARVADF
jgi:hypothetical protein